MRYLPSPTVRSMVVYGASGLAFAGANLLLARQLSTEQYALVTLVVALVTLGYHLSPVGLDAVVTRRRLPTNLALLKRLALAAGLAASAFSLLAVGAYGLSLTTGIVLLVATVAGALMLVAAARFQSDQRFTLALALLLSSNSLLLLGALVVLGLDAAGALVPLLILALGLVVAAAVGWTLALRGNLRSAHATAQIPWNEAISLAGVAAAGMLLIQLERLVIPYVLPLADLALFGVLGAIAGSLFRLLQMGVGFTLLPRLRNAATVFERRRLIAQELRLAIVISLGGATAILALTPLIERWLLAGKYHLPLALVIAAIFSGIAKIAHAFAKAAATALATPRELALMNGAGWVSVALGICCAAFASRWGLMGVVYGVGLGWLTWALLAFTLIAHHLRQPATLPVES